MIEGKINFYHERKQYGFIEADETDEDVFFSLDEFSEGQPYLSGIDSVEEGEYVLIEVEWRDKGPIVSKMIRGRECDKHGRKMYHDEEDRWFCPFCTRPDMVRDKAPTVYDKDGNPMKVRLIGAECEGEVAGEGIYGYIWEDIAEKDSPAVYFEKHDEN